MLLFDRQNARVHLSWLVIVVTVSVAAAGWCIAWGFTRDSATWRWPSGSSLPGFTLGVAGGLIMAFEMLLWPRKAWWRGKRMGRTKTWMKLHLWLGVLALPLLFLHGGFHFNPGRSTLAAVLMWLLLIVGLSGIVGCILQNILPRLLLDHVPAETIASQINYVLRRYRDEAARLVAATCGDQDSSTPAAFTVTERVRSAGGVQGKVAESTAAPRAVPGSEILRLFFDTQVAPFLGADRVEGHPLASRRHSAALFDGLKLQLASEAHGTVDRLADLCEQRRQFDLQRQLHFWLHSWLAVHLALSTALFLLMLVHIFLALKFI